MTLRIGTRASALAMAQSGTIAEQLGGELVPIVSEGDTSTASLSTLGGRGVFANALREALLAGEVEVLVHSYKDLPTTTGDRLAIAGVPQRADARRAGCARNSVTVQALTA